MVIYVILYLIFNPPELSRVPISHCKCPSRSLPIELVKLGYFPCTPKRPELAIKIQYLEFMRHHFLRMPPNITAWAAGLESYLASRKFRLGRKVLYEALMAMNVC